MCKLSFMEIKNIKGLKSKLLQIDLFANKPTLFVAPNGFGKSSIACAFSSLNNNRIALDDKNCHQGDKNLKPYISLKLGENLFAATASSNDISKNLDVFVIKNPLLPKATTKNMGKFSVATASLEVSSVVLIQKIPPNKKLTYSISELRKGFGPNGKVLNKIENFLKNKSFIAELERSIDIDKFTKIRTYQNPINQLIEKINMQKGSAESIKSWAENNCITEFSKILELEKLRRIISKYFNLPIIDQYLFAYQIAELSRKADYKDAIKYILYLKDKEFFDELLNSLNSTRFTIKTAEYKKTLIVRFPQANEISNGQRDILSLVAQLQRVKRKSSKEHCVLLIDEIFDYLDDANLVSFQFYITKLIEEFKKEQRYFYPILLTHLDPNYFRHSCFNKHRVQIRYLEKNDNRKGSEFLKLVKHRELEHIKANISKYYLHYNPTVKNMSSEFKALKLRTSWNDSYSFYESACKQLNKYLCDQEYDPIGVLLAVRILIEFSAYNSLDDLQKVQFIKTHKTKNKLNYCVEECGSNIQEVHYLLGIIYNDNLHWHEQRDYETPLYSKLSNPTIKRMISDLSLSDFLLHLQDIRKAA